MIRFMSLLVVLAMVTTMVLTPFAPVQAQSGVTVPITGTIGSGGTFTGTFTVLKFVSDNGQFLAKGKLSGTLTNAVGQVIGTVTNQNVTLPVSSISGTCQILHLELGPLDL